MNIKHRVMQDYQFVTSDKKIVVLKANTILENYTYRTKGSNDSIKIDKDIIENNSGFFKTIDWKEELHSFIKTNKIPQPAILAKKIAPFIEEMFIVKSDPVSQNDSNNILADELKFKESQIEAKSKRLEVLEKQLLEEQQKISDKEIEFLRKEKDFKEKLKYSESNNLVEDRYKKELESLQKKQIELLDKEKELFEKQAKLEMLEMREKKFIADQSELSLKIEELTTREKIVKEKEAQMKGINIDDIAMKEINLGSIERRIELKETQIKSELESLKIRELEVIQIERRLNDKEDVLKKKEIDLNKKESDLNTEEINLLDLSNRLQKMEEELKEKELNMKEKFSVEKLFAGLESLKGQHWTDPSYEQYFLPKLKSLIGMGYV